MNNLEKLISNLSNYWDISPDKVVDRLNFMNEQEINKIVDKMTKKFKNGGPLPKAKFENGGIMKCLKGGKTYSECMKCGGKPIVKNQEPAGPLGSSTDGMGLNIQLPNRERDLKYTNIISRGKTGKAATWIPRNGRKQITRFLMADNNPDVPGYANDIQMEIPRDPRTGELGRDTVLRNKILPGL